MHCPIDILAREKVSANIQLSLDLVFHLIKRNLKYRRVQGTSEKRKKKENCEKAKLNENF